MPWTSVSLFYRQTKKLNLFTPWNYTKIFKHTSNSWKPCSFPDFNFFMATGPSSSIPCRFSKTSLTMDFVFSEIRAAAFCFCCFVSISYSWWRTQTTTHLNQQPIHIETKQQSRRLQPEISEKTKLGEGGFGKVYKVSLKRGRCHKTKQQKHTLRDGDLNSRLG